MHIRSRSLLWLLWPLLVLSVTRLWLMPLPSSFWADEMGTAFVVHHGAGDPSLKVAPQMALSAYYVLPKLAEKIAGFSEIAYRLPSALLMALALFLIARLAARLIHPRAAWFAAFVCMALRGFDYQAADARPYALNTAVAAASAWFLVRWLDSARWRDALLFVGTAALLWRIHLADWPFYLLLVLYAAVRLARGETSVPKLHVAGAFALMGLSLVPMLPSALGVLRGAHTHVLAALPSADDVFRSLKPEIFAICIVGTWLLARLLRRKTAAEGPHWNFSSMVLVLGWWLCQPAGLFAISWLNGNSVYLSRYLWLSLPGAALTVTAIVSRIIPANRWHTAATVLGFGVLLCLGRWQYVWPPHNPSNWRAAAQAIERQAPGPRTPVLCISPFIEARYPAWYPGYPPTGVLFAQLQVYPIHGQPYLLPHIDSPEAEQFAAAILRNELASRGRFFVYGMLPNVQFWQAWLKKRPELTSWTSERLGSFGDVGVVEFTAPVVKRPGTTDTEVEDQIKKHSF